MFGTGTAFRRSRTAPPSACSCPAAATTSARCVARCRVQRRRYPPPPSRAPVVRFPRAATEPGHFRRARPRRRRPPPGPQVQATACLSATHVDQFLRDFHVMADKSARRRPVTASCFHHQQAVAIPSPVVHTCGITMCPDCSPPSGISARVALRAYRSPTPTVRTSTPASFIAICRPRLPRRSSPAHRLSDDRRYHRIRENRHDHVAVHHGARRSM